MHRASGAAAIAVSAAPSLLARGTAKGTFLRTCASIRAAHVWARQQSQQSSFRSSCSRSPGPRCFASDAGLSSTGLPTCLRRVTSKDLDAWASGPAVHGHAHSRPSFEPYALSPVRQLGSGADSAPGWSTRLLSAAGMKGSGGPNQDAFSYTTLGRGWIVCVTCDGHGEQGEVISERAARMLPLFLSVHLDTLSMAEALPLAFADAQSDLERCFSAQQVWSGATVAMCCLHVEQQAAWVAHVGDSRVVLGDLTSGQVVFCTDEHKAHDPEEYSRLEAAGAQVIQKRYDDGEVVSRIFIPKTGVPGLAMSRSLGDGCLKKYGVSAEPEVADITGLWQDCAAPTVILASDGLWDTIGVEETVAALAARCRSGRDVAIGVEALLRRSQRRWIEAEGDYCDDVTVLLVAPSASLVSKEAPSRQSTKAQV
eukprot:TRINITY_DN99321_c0_g1_i1.p1 TRINITY_DN99321_c0_g1~~TRINITY_DN99321_c0_g1_i1.p1  ORF type:complete len:425 (+),score=43.87 TRINITY_DN99321_c0_g1_i1:64-1338(+)